MPDTLVARMPVESSLRRSPRCLTICKKKQRVRNVAATVWRTRERAHTHITHTTQHTEHAHR